MDLLQTAGTPVLVPDPVIQEIQAKGPADATALAVASSPWLITVPAPSIPHQIAAWDLGAGESSVLAWAEAHAGAVVILDDGQARRCAAALGIPCIGTLGLVLSAKRKGQIPSARTVVEKLIAHGMYLSNHVIDRALSMVGE